MRDCFKEAKIEIAEGLNKFEWNYMYVYDKIIA